MFPYPNKRRQMQRKQRKGVALIYITVAMTAMLAFCSLAVDLGRAQMVKTQLHSTADAAAQRGPGNHHRNIHR